MAKVKTQYSCSGCGSIHSKWSGQCGECGEWNTLQESVAPSTSKAAEKSSRFQSYSGEISQVKSINDVDLKQVPRTSTGLSELDRVLGGGLVQGSVTLIGGDPGIGKSTILIQTLASLGSLRSLYVTGEESLQQVSMRANRLELNTDSLRLLTETCVERIIEHASIEKPEVMVIDSIQTIHTEELNSAPGSVGQVREATARLTRFAKQTNTSLFIAGHVTKEGTLAGPRVLEHMVDTVLYFEGDPGGRYRILRAVKNRFGAVNELGVFAMTEKGLIGVSNPSAIFLSRHEVPVSGSIIMVTREGTRPLLVEVQALVDESHGQQARRVVLGLEQNRIAMLLAVLHRHGGVSMFDQDVFLNVVGGMKITETAADLPMILAALSSFRNRPHPADLVVFGEVGLAGEIRPVPNGEERLKEAFKHGFKKAIIPKGNMPQTKIAGMKIMTAQPSILIVSTSLLLYGCDAKEILEDIGDSITGEFVDYASPLVETVSNASDPARVLPPNPTGCPDWQKNSTIEITESTTLPQGCKYDRVSILIKNQSNLVFDCNGAELNGLDKEFRQAVGVPYSVEKAPREFGIRVQSSETVQSNNVTVKNCNLTNYVRGIMINYSINASSRSDLKNNINVDALEARLRTLSPKNIRVENSNIKFSHKDGLFVGRFITDFVLDSSTIQYTGAVGLYLDSGSQRNTIQNSTISENGHSDYSSSTRVRRQKLANDSREGIAIDSSAQNIIQNNVFTKNSRGAILIYKNCNEHAQDPTQTPRYQSADSNLIQNNQFISEKIGVWVASRQSKDLAALECGSPIVATGTVRYGPVEEDAYYYEDFAKHNTISQNTFNKVLSGIIVEDDDTSILANTFEGATNFDVIVGTKYRTANLSHPVTGTKIENNQFNSSTSNHVQLQYDPIETTIKNNTPASSNEQLQQDFINGTKIGDLLKKRSQTIDVLLVELWEGHAIPSAALIAVGGYGREEMHPASDVDLLLLLNEEPDEVAEEQLSGFVTILWDMGLEIGHSVRTVDECVTEASNDLTVISNLIESRFLSGNETLFHRLQSEISSDNIWSSQEFFLQKIEEQYQRYKRYGDTAYRVEPNLKDGPGGLRDLQTIGWIAIREYGVHSLKELENYDLLNPDEYKSLIEARDFLWKVRFSLHQITGRKEDRLLFDHQRALAHSFGYTNDENNQSIESFMQRYYRTITKLERLNEMLLGLLREKILQTNQIPPVNINGYYHQVDGFLGLTEHNLFETRPHTLMEVFHIMQTRPEIKGLTPETLRALKRNLHLIDDDYRNNEHHKQIFIQIVSESKGITFALRRMNRYGVLAAYIPAFENIVGRMQYDLFHAYTVDDHTLNVIRNIRRLSTKSGAESLPLCSKIFKNLQIPRILYLAGLFHDIAKGRGGSHSELGAVDALEFCLSHNINQHDSETVSWLVKNHLLMSSIAQRKDITDPEVIQEFTDKVITQHRLDYLYLLTICDIKGTNPTLLNSWKHSLLKDLYRATKRQIQSVHSASKNSKELIEKKKESVITQLEKKGIEKAYIDAFWERFDKRYILQHTVESLSWHISEIFSQSKRNSSEEEEQAIIRIIPNDNNRSSVLFIYTKNQEKLFIKIASALEQQHLNIVAARINTSIDGYILDTLNILTADNEMLTLQRDRDQLIENLQKNLSIKELSYDFNQYRTPRQLKHFDTPTHVNFELDEKRQHSIIKITTADSIGLLTRISQVFIELNLTIHDAKIATLGEIAEDIFHVTTRSGHVISETKKQEQIRTAIKKKLHPLNNS
ncbi:Bifunctional uridylyltransferase/uridylyl-removing enzyme [Nymphon striatum]|nr:Bifunctional uridylyltransferase/uridylyl-removing enzyme [Nymphon striatum]